jgi:hypothetical protein
MTSFRGGSAQPCRARGQPSLQRWLGSHMCLAWTVHTHVHTCAGGRARSRYRSGGKACASYGPSRAVPPFGARWAASHACRACYAACMRCVLRRMHAVRATPHACRACYAACMPCVLRRMHAVRATPHACRACYVAACIAVVRRSKPALAVAGRARVGRSAHSPSRCRRLRACGPLQVAAGLCAPSGGSCSARRSTTRH